MSETAFNATGAGKPPPPAPPPRWCPGRPQNLAAPKILGTAQVGQTLTSQAGKWSNGTNELLLSWLRCEAGECHPIEGATAHTYKLTRPTPGCRSA